MAYSSNPKPISYDASARARVSILNTMFDGKVLGADNTLLFENAGTGTATYSSNKVNLSVTSGQYIIRQTKRFTPYFAGKSQFVECTFDNFQSQANVTKRVGYFSSSATAPHTANFDGIFIEDNGTSKSLQCYRNGTQTVNVAFTAMDNAALISGQDWSNFNVVAFDFLWLGGAVLRFFVKTATGFELIHTVNYSGTTTDTFTLSPNQPLRYEVRSSTGTGSLRYICSQVATEGSFDESGNSLSLVISSPLTTNSVGTIYAIKSIKKQAAFRDTPVQIVNFGCTPTATNEAGIICLILNPTLSSAITYANNSRIQEGTPTNQTITAGTGRVLAAAVVSVASSVSLKTNTMAFLGSTITNVMDEIVLAYIPQTTNQSVSGFLEVKEY